MTASGVSMSVTPGKMISRTDSSLSKQAASQASGQQPQTRVQLFNTFPMGLLVMGCYCLTTRRNTVQTHLISWVLTESLPLQMSQRPVVLDVSQLTQEDNK